MNIQYSNVEIDEKIKDIWSCVLMNYEIGHGMERRSLLIVALTLICIMIRRLTA